MKMDHNKGGLVLKGKLSWHALIKPLLIYEIKTKLLTEILS
jgi:hypothetical protein